MSENPYHNIDSLCIWLRANSSGYYRLSAHAALVIEDLNARLKSAESERDALREKVEYKEKEVKYAFESLALIRNQAQNYEEEIRRLMKDNQALREEIMVTQEQEPAIRVIDGKIVDFNPNYNGDLDGDFYASPAPAQNWMPIETAPDNEWVLVTGNNMIGDPPEGRFYMRAKKEDDEFISTDGFGEIYNPGYLTHWTHEPNSNEKTTTERLPY